MQPPLSHLNCREEQTGQFSSSLLSAHSAKPSQRHAIGMQSISPVVQVNCSVEQVGGSERQGEGENMVRRMHAYASPPPPPTTACATAHLRSAAGPAARPGERDRSSEACRPVWRCRCGSSLRCHGNRGDFLQVKRARCFREPDRFVHEETVLLRTQVLPGYRLGGMDGRQGGQASLDAGSSLSGQFVHPFDHLLLPIDPVQVLAQNRQSRRLQDAGILEDNPIGSWGERAEPDQDWSELQVDGKRSFLTCQVTALDAFEVRIHPEQLSHFVVQSQSDGSEQAGGEEALPLCSVQAGRFDLRRALLDGGEIHVPAEERLRVRFSAKKVPSEKES